MPDSTNNTFTEYLGSEFQLKLLWQFLVEPEFAIKIYPDLCVDYFDEMMVKRLFVIISEYIKNFEKAPNIQNKSIHQAITLYKTQSNKIEEELLFTYVKRIEMYNEMVINKPELYDGDVVQRIAYDFIKQQEYRKLGEHILNVVKKGNSKNVNNIKNIEEDFQRISCIGDGGDDSEDVFDNIDNALRIDFRETIPTGIEVIDALTGGGLGKGEIGLILTPSGIGKTTILTKIANTAYDVGKNVLQIIFEDTKDQVKRKHYAIFTKTPLSELDNNIDYLRSEVRKIREESRTLGGRLIIKPFSQDGTTMLDIKNWIHRYQKKYGIVFDIIILDYLDCVESHKRVSDRNENELVVVKGFEALASELNIPAWSAIQTNRTGFNAEFIEANQSGGSIKRIQKSHFFMSVGKSQDQKESNLATISILKARFAKDGQVFKDCIFNNDTLEIRIIDGIQKTKAFAKNLKRVEHSDVERIENRIESLENDNDDKVKSALDDMRDKFLSKQNENDTAIGQEIQQKTESSENLVKEVENDNSYPIDVTPKPIVNYLDIESQFLSEEDMKNDDDIERYLRENRKNNEN